MFDKVIMITGGAGFIGSHVVRLFVRKYPNYKIINFDALTYAGNLENLKDIENYSNYVFVKGDIRDVAKIQEVFDEYNVTDIIHLAAESHVDRSILNPTIFVETNVLGTINLLNVAKEYWKADYDAHRFHHVSTDEVYGSLTLNTLDKFTESTAYDPHSPYSASKASSDHFVNAYHDTYGMNITMSNCSNNYGPNQFPEKLIPLVIDKILNNETIPVYGTGENIRDWLYVKDHARAIDTIFHKGISGETFNIGGNCEMRNIDIVKTIINIIECYDFETEDANIKDIDFDKYITYVNDRPGHDLRYAINCENLTKTLGWEPSETFVSGITKTIKWYLDNQGWVNHIKSGEYLKWLETNYASR